MLYKDDLSNCRGGWRETALIFQLHQSTSGLHLTGATGTPSTALLLPSIGKRILQISDRSVSIAEPLSDFCVFR